MASDNSCSREEHVDLILLDSILHLDSRNILAHTLTFTSQDSLVDREAVALDSDDSAVCRDPISNRDCDDISGYELVRLDAGNMAISENLGFVRRVFL